MNQEERITELERKVDLLADGLKSTLQSFGSLIDLLKIKTD
jgi:hypothetical protein